MKAGFLMVMLVATVVLATACGDDDSKDSPETGPATAVEGTYNGNLALYVLDEEQSSDSASLILTATGGNTVSVDMGVMDAMGSELGPVVLEGVSVIAIGETYALAADSIVVPNVPYGASTVTATITMDGETDADKNLTATFTMMLGAMPFPVVGYFTTE